MFPKSRFSKRIFGHSMRSTKLDRPPFREQKTHIRKNHIKFLTTPWTGGCPWDTRPVSRQKGPFSVGFFCSREEVPGTPAGRPLFVPPGVLGRDTRPVSQGFFLILCAFLFPDHCKHRASQTCLGANVPSGLVPSTSLFRNIFGHSWGLVCGEGGAPGTVPLHNLRVTSHVLHQEVPLGWYRARLF